MSKTPERNPEVLLFQMKDREFLQDINKTKHSGDSLGDDCCIRAAFYSHSKADDKRNIQPHIDHRGDNQEIKR